MKKLILMLALVVITVKGHSQAITVNTNTYSVPQLVNSVLINSPCVSATNITWKTGTNYGSTNGIGYFQNNNPHFPMQSGVILSTGNVTNAAGPNTSVLNDGAANWPGDSNLENTLLQSGISMNSVNASILEFDFTPISPTFNFEFLFASEEYGNFQCQFSDAFAFLLTNTSTGVTTNLAVVPNTTLPISVVTIRDFLYNSSCPSANAQYFGSYNGGSAAAGSAINYNGQTKLMNASATLVPQTMYHIKLVIADRSDSSSDSAIFISSDTFNIGQDVLGLDLTSANNTALCFGATRILNSNLNPSLYNFTWTKDGVAISGETGANLTITQPGTYGLTYLKNDNSCQPITDYITVEYLPEILGGTPKDIYKCTTGSATYSYDLSVNTPIVKVGLNPSTEVSYYASLLNANSGTNPLPTMYTSAPGQTIYVRIKNQGNACYVVKSFQILTVLPPVAHQVPNLVRCATSTFNNSAFNLSQQNATVLGDQLAANYTVSYYTSQNNANSGTNPVNANAFYATNNTVVYVRVQNNFDTSCYGVSSFTLNVTPLPLVDTLVNVVLCDSYTLPPLTNGNYFSAANGNGFPMAAGDVITETKTIYIFNQPNGPNGCSAGSSFLVTIIDPMAIVPPSEQYCGNYTLPPLVVGHYFTNHGGTGTEIAPGTTITTSQTINVYFQAAVAPYCTINQDFSITVFPFIDLGIFNNVFECTSYTLPALSIGKYFTEPNGGGTELLAGTVMSSSQTIYVYAVSDQGCTSQVPFDVVIGAFVQNDVSQCEPYTLPALQVGHYYSGPQGTGTQIAPGTVINTSQMIYVYVPSSGESNCTDNLHFSVTIFQPVIDILDNITVCGSYTLPTLVSGDYYTGLNGTGNQLHAGDLITNSQTMYIFKRSTSNDCSNQSSFVVTVNAAPLIDSRSDIDICNSYVLTPLSQGNYYTGPHGTGTMLPTETVITTSQTIYIYAVSLTAPDCYAENSFDISIFSIEADSPSNVVACDSYTLPPLTIGNYFLASGGPSIGEGNLLNAGDVITTSKTIYVYTESGERINCTDENSFTVTINVSPVIAPIPNVNATNSYTLPALAVGNYYTGPNGTGVTMHEGDIILTNITLYVFAETGTVPNCSDEKSFYINIFNVDNVPNVTICESYTLPALSIGGYYTGPHATGTHLFAGQTITTTKTIYVYAAAPFDAFSYDESTFIVTIVDAPIVAPISNSILSFCDEDGTNDGVTTFDLTQLNAAVLGSQTGSEYSVTYYASFENAVAAINNFNLTDLKTIYVRVTNTLTANCFDVKVISLIVNKLPEPTPVDGQMCYDSKNNILLNPYTINSGLSDSYYTIKWYNEVGDVVGSGSNYQAVLPGVYSVIATDIQTGCASAATPVTVTSSEPAIVSYNMTDDFSENQVITVGTSGMGDYEFQLDFGPFQDSATFQNVSSGTHTITVRDKNGCGLSTSEALVVNYPKFFTPNGDGYNDTWNIVDLKGQKNAMIYIYDRYGKLISQIRPKGQGWDGSLSGQALPSDDYWFTISYQEDAVEKEYKSHFAMKR